MLITDQDAAQLIDLSIRYTCAKLQVREFGIIEHDELLAGIRRKDPETCGILMEFLTSYRAWFQFHKNLDRDGKQGALSHAEIQELEALSTKKDAGRTRITERLRHLA